MEELLYDRRQYMCPCKIYVEFSGPGPSAPVAFVAHDQLEAAVLLPPAVALAQMTAGLTSTAKAAKSFPSAHLHLRARGNIYSQTDRRMCLQSCCFAAPATQS